MARYNRELLVPYLQNICALQLARKRLQSWHWNARKKRDNCRVYYSEPKEPDFEEPVGCVFALVAAVAFLICTMAIGIGSPPEGDKVGVWVCLVLLCVCVFCFILKCKAVNARNDQRREEYYEELRAYKKHYDDEVESVEQEKTQIQKRMDGYQRNIKRIDALLEQMYSANIIPVMYRDCYAAVYLYNWFSTGGSDDLDHALSMYVLEEIKSRLDIIIQNQSQMILNQSIMMANQVRSMEQRRQYENMMRAKVNQLQATSDERLRYTRMIESNTSALAFFATANYLRNN